MKAAGPRSERRLHMMQQGIVGAQGLGLGRRGVRILVVVGD